MRQEIPSPWNGLLAVGGALSVILAWQFLLPFAGVPSYILPTPIEISQIFAKESRSSGRISGPPSMRR